MRTYLTKLTMLLLLLSTALPLSSANDFNQTTFPLSSDNDFNQTIGGLRYYLNGIFDPYAEAYCVLLPPESGTYEGDIVLPPSVTFKGRTYPLRNIGMGAFTRATKLTSVTLPDVPFAIGMDAFAGCGISQIVIPGGVTKIDFHAFANCAKLQKVRIEKGQLKTIGSRAFEQCQQLTDIQLPSTLESIGLGAFGECSKLTTLTLPEGLKKLESHAFWQCSNLEQVALPASLGTLGEKVFIGCPKLQNITVSPESKHFSSIEGELYDNTGTRLYRAAVRRYVPHEKYTLRPSVKVIEAGAFSNAHGLADITFPEGLTGIGSNAFSACQSLASIVLPTTIDTLGTGAFYTVMPVGCALTSISILASQAPKCDPNDKHLFPPQRFIHVPRGAKGYNVAPWTNWPVVYDLDPSTVATPTAPTFSAVIEEDDIVLHHLKPGTVVRVLDLAGRVLQSAVASASTLRLTPAIAGTVLLQVDGVTQKLVR